jgi:hypothetical protein
VARATASARSSARSGCAPRSTRCWYAYLALASDLADSHLPARAIAELQDALDLVTAGGAPTSGDASRAVDRLVVALAALYDRTGDRRLARWVASGVDPRPTWTSAVGPRAEPA